MVGGDAFENTVQRAGFDRAVIRHSDMMRAVDRSREADVRTFLPAARARSRANAEPSQVHRLQDRGDFHTDKTSSRTKCSRIILGFSPA